MIAFELPLLMEERQQSDRPSRVLASPHSAPACTCSRPAASILSIPTPRMRSTSS